MISYQRTPPPTRAFNARWLTPAEVAEQFVPVPAFQKLIAIDHSVLLGPRGSGKTTLLKMLTRPALAAWEKAHSPDMLTISGELPSFEAIYLPSDVRWSTELTALGTDPAVGAEYAALIQRFLVTLSSVQSVGKAFRGLLEGEPGLEKAIVSSIRNLWPLPKPPATLAQLDIAVRTAAQEVRGIVNRRRADEIALLVGRLPEMWLAHPLDMPIALCEIFAAHTVDRVRGHRWAFCFDELEIAPDWLRNELLASWRSVDQPYLLKLTWTPVLPKTVRGNAERDQDFKPIVLWHAHAHEAREFAGQLAARFVRRNFGPNVTPYEVFGHSSGPGAAGEELPDAPKYERGSQEYEEFKALAARESGFAQLLRKNGIDPADPFTPEPDKRDRLLRKLRPIVAMRLAFLKENAQFRSRKAVPEIYSGIEVLYDVCEGNPRWLQNLFSELFNEWAGPEPGDPLPFVDPAKQARVLESFALRFHDELYARRVSDLGEERHLRWSVGDLVDRVGDALSARIFSEPFPLDPVGSFRVDTNQPAELLSLLASGLDVGAFVYIGTASNDAPSELVGSNLRLSYRLAPYYRLPLRSYRHVTLQTLLQSERDSTQIGLFTQDGEDA